MRILLVNDFFTHISAGEKLVISTSKILREHGHEVFFFATDKKPYLEPDYKYADFFPKFIDPINLKEATAISDIILYKIIKKMYNYEAEKKLDQLIKEIKPDIVHINNTFILTCAIMRACHKNNIPMVMTLHQANLFCPAVSLMYRSENYCKNELCIKGNPIPYILNRCQKRNLLSIISISIEHFLRYKSGLMNKIDKFICPSQAILELAVRSGIQREKLVHIDNFLDNISLDIQPEYTNKGYFLYAGRLTPAKGIHYLLKAMQYLPEAKLRIVGKGYYEINLKNLAKKLNLNNVEFVGFKSGEELEEEYRGCIANILPCNAFETFGLTIIESFVHGKPTIASRIGGIPEIIDDGVNGILIEPGNVDELVNAMKNLFSNNDLIIQMGKNGRAKAENMYNSSIHYEKLINAYNSILQ